jgi:anti-sigma B factor antagonist
VKITSQVDDGVARLSISGELDMSTTPDLREQVAVALAGDHLRSLVIDAVDLEFCDSSGIQALVQARSAAVRQGITFQLANVRGVTRRVLQVTGVLDELSR